MIIAVLSDIHANRAALEAVLADSTSQHAERYWVLGDICGYGPHPREAVSWLRNNVAAQDWVIGNHEAIMMGLMSEKTAEQVNGSASVVARRHLDMLAEDPEVMAFAQAEFQQHRVPPKTHAIAGQLHILTHSRPNDYLRYLYAWQKEIYLPEEFNRLAEEFNQDGVPRIQWFGHTHVPTFVYQKSAGDSDLSSEFIAPFTAYPLTADTYLINPGSVGQPRDMDRRAAYALLDTEAKTVTFRRVAYNWRRVASDLQQLDFPENLVKRLRDATSIKDTPKEWRDHYQYAKNVQENHPGTL